MGLSMLPLVIKADAVFIRAPGVEEEETLMPGEKSVGALIDGTLGLLNTGVVTLVVLPALALLLYLTGYRVAGPMLALFACGLFLARMFGAPA